MASFSLSSNIKKWGKDMYANPSILDIFQFG